MDVAAWGIIPCVSKINTLGPFHSLLKGKRNLTSDYGGASCIEVEKGGRLPLYCLLGGWFFWDPDFGFLYFFGWVFRVPGSVLVLRA